MEVDEAAAVQGEFTAKQEEEHPEDAVGHVDVNNARVAIPRIEFTLDHERDGDAVLQSQDAREHDDDRDAVPRSELATREMEQPASTVGTGAPGNCEVHCIK